MSGFVEAISLADRFVRAARRAPDAAALVVDGTTVSYGALLDAADEVARALIASGVEQGEHVGLLMPTGTAFATAFVGVALAGARVVPLNTRYRRRELRYLVEQAELKALLTTDVVDEHVNFVELLTDCFPRLATAEPGRLRLTDAPRLSLAVLMGATTPPGFLGRDEFLARAVSVPATAVRERRERVRLRDVAVISYTSGTTSWPKGCMLTHEALSRHWDHIRERAGAGPGERCWAPSPMFHAAGYGALVMMAGVEGSVLTQAHFTPEGAVDLLTAHRPTFLYSPFPPVTDAVLDEAARRDADLGAARVLIYASPSPERFDAVSKLLPEAAVVQPYGQTESTAMVTMGDVREPYEVRRAGCGPLFPGVEARLVDPATGEPTPDGAIGEIQFRGHNSFEGYFREPERTAETILPDGWVRSGDAGRRNEHGQLVFAGRFKDMLKVGGENVSAAEVEAHLETHPAVRVAQVVAAPDTRLGEVPAAFVELRPGATASPEDLVEHCRGQVAAYKVPRHVRFVSEWPMSATKIQKTELRARIAAELSAPASAAGTGDERDHGRPSSE